MVLQRVGDLDRQFALRRGERLGAGGRVDVAAPHVRTVEVLPQLALETLHGQSVVARPQRRLRLAHRQLAVGRVVLDQRVEDGQGRAEVLAGAEHVGQKQLDALVVRPLFQHPATILLRQIYLVLLETQAGADVLHVEVAVQAFGQLQGVLPAPGGSQGGEELAANRLVLRRQGDGLVEQGDALVRLIQLLQRPAEAAR